MDTLDRHVKLTPASTVHQAGKQIYGIDVSTWHETRLITLPYRWPLCRARGRSSRQPRSGRTSRSSCRDGIVAGISSRSRGAR